MPLPRVEFQGRQVVELRSGPSRALICPEAGGRLLLWEINGRRIIHWPATADWTRPAKIRGGNPILFPFIARHYVDGVMDRWRDPQGTLRDMPMHGFARDSCFSVETNDRPFSCTLLLVPSPQTAAWYPYDFRFRVQYELDDHALAVTFSTQNAGPEPLPYYAGHHFYFDIPAADRPAWNLDLPPVDQARQRADGSVEELGTSRSRFTLDDPDLQDIFHILRTSGPVTMQNRDGRNLVFELPNLGAPWHAVTTWTQAPDSPFYCVEPWLGLPNAIHHGRGLRWLAPGIGESATCTIRASGW